jgi:hypothetical protein
MSHDAVAERQRAWRYRLQPSHEYPHDEEELCHMIWISIQGDIRELIEKRMEAEPEHPVSQTNPWSALQTIISVLAEIQQQQRTPRDIQLVANFLTGNKQSVSMCIDLQGPPSHPFEVAIMIVDDNHIARSSVFYCPPTEPMMEEFMTQRRFSHCLSLPQLRKCATAIHNISHEVRVQCLRYAVKSVIMRSPMTAQFLEQSQLDVPSFIRPLPSWSERKFKTGHKRALFAKRNSEKVAGTYCPYRTHSVPYRAKPEAPEDRINYGYTCAFYGAYELCLENFSIPITCDQEAALLKAVVML